MTAALIAATTDAHILTSASQSITTQLIAVIAGALKTTGSVCTGVFTRR